MAARTQTSAGMLVASGIEPVRATEAPPVRAGISIRADFMCWRRGHGYPGPLARAAPPYVLDPRRDRGGPRPERLRRRLTRLAAADQPSAAALDLRIRFPAARRSGPYARHAARSGSGHGQG